MGQNVTLVGRIHTAVRGMIVLSLFIPRTQYNTTHTVTYGCGDKSSAIHAPGHEYMHILVVLVCTAFEQSTPVRIEYTRAVYANCIIKIKIHSSCEIEDFVETYLCKLCVILRSRVLLGVWDIARRLPLELQNSSVACHVQQLLHVVVVSRASSCCSY